MFFGNKKAQGTIEYLVILAVIVVVSLIVVSLLINSTSGAEGISSGTSKIGGWTNTISVTESAISPDGNYLVRLANNTGEPVTIKTVKIGDQDVNYSEDLFQGNQQNFKITSDMVCEVGQTVVGELVVTYVSVNGLEHTEVFPADITFECNDYIVNLLANQCPEVGEGGCTLTGDATEAEVLYGKTFYSDDSETLLTGDLNLVELHSGQTMCYDGSNDPVICPPITGPQNQDAQYNGTAKSYQPDGCGDGTVLDNHTGLCWHEVDSGSDATYNATCGWGAPYGDGCLTWSAAFDYCEASTTGGHPDWRVPSFVELATLPDMSYPSSSYLNSVFTKSSAWNNKMYGYWSSTTVPSSTSGAYYLYSDDGAITYGSLPVDAFGVRCVRSES